MKPVIGFYKFYKAMLWLVVVLFGLVLFSRERSVNTLTIVISAIIALVSISYLSRRLHNIDLYKLNVSLPFRILIRALWITLGFLICVAIWVFLISMMGGFIPHSLGIGILFLVMFFFLSDGLKWFGVLGGKKKKIKKRRSSVKKWIWRIFWGIRFKNKGLKRLFICGIAPVYLISSVIYYEEICCSSYGDFLGVVFFGLGMCIPYILIIRLVSWVVSGFSSNEVNSGNAELNNSKATPDRLDPSSDSMMRPIIPDSGEDAMGAAKRNNSTDYRQSK